MRKLGTQNIRVYNLTGRALANLMTSGEVALSPTIYNSHVAASADKGAPLGWFAPGPVPVTDTGVAIARKAPHPHAAMLFDRFPDVEGGAAALPGARLRFAAPRRGGAGAQVQKLYLTNRAELHPRVRGLGQALSGRLRASAAMMTFAVDAGA